MTKAPSKFKKDSICIDHPDHDLECFSVGDGAAYMLFEESGESRLAIETSTDFIDFEDSELVGGSEITLRLWGIPAGAKVLDGGLQKPISPKVDSWKHKQGHVFAQFFANEFFTVHEMQVSFPGKKRLQVMMKIADLTEESDDPCTTIWVDTGLMSNPAELERPE